jgi:signal transduction histidine kinase
LVEVPPFVDGAVNKDALDKIMHSMMAVNPGLEVYLLDPAGKILSFVVLDKKVHLKQIDTAPIKKFLQTKGSTLIYGDDPKSPAKQKVFSAAPIMHEGNLQGYVYMILAGEEYESAFAMLQNSYLLRMGVQFFFLALLGAFLVGIAGIWLLTRNLRKFTKVVNEFEHGNYHVRMPENASGEWVLLASTFNKMADSILQNIDNLKEVNSLRKELIANVSHDLRTPIAIVQGYLETLEIKDETLTPAQRREYLSTVLKSLKKLNVLVADLFELSKLEARQIQLKKESFVFSELINDMHAKYHLLTKERNIQLEVCLEDKAAIVEADLALMERVIQNLLDNAIKYTPDYGHIEIKMKMMEEKQVQFSISNSGPGIQPAVLPKIFDRYFKGKSTGSGLGLAIVKNILDIHQARVFVESIPNDYTEFSFVLPTV